MFIKVNKKKWPLDRVVYDPQECKIRYQFQLIVFTGQQLVAYDIYACLSGTHVIVTNTCMHPNTVIIMLVFCLVGLVYLLCAELFRYSRSRDHVCCSHTMPYLHHLVG